MSANPKAKENHKSFQVKGAGRSTGPRSIQGKAKSSQNAVSHGLTSNRVMPDEIRMVDEFSKELSDYYQPESPLEVLQIQRIAFCRAKLAKLIDIEVAGREIIRRQIDLDPDLVMQRLTQYPEDLRSLVLASIKGESILTELDLDEPTWNLIVQEIKDFEGTLGRTLEGESDLRLNFPKLCEYLLGLEPVGDQINDIGVDQALMLFGYKIHYILNDRIKTFNVKNKNQKGPKEARVDELLGRVRRRKQINKMFTRKEVRTLLPGAAGYHMAVDSDFQEIKKLASLLNQVPMVLQSFHEMKSWMMRAADLQLEEADRMMKYQNMLERRLSSAIGELLELRKCRIK